MSMFGASRSLTFNWTKINHVALFDCPITRRKRSGVELITSGSFLIDRYFAGGSCWGFGGGSGSDFGVGSGFIISSRGGGGGAGVTSLGAI